MTSAPTEVRTAASEAGAPARGGAPWWPLVTTRLLEQRRRRGLMVAVVLLSVGAPVLVVAIRLFFHLVDPSSYGPAGTPGVFTISSNLMAEFGFLAAAVLGTAAGTTDLSDGVFRHLVVTGRSRVALYLARLPAGLMVLIPLVAAGFLAVCLVCTFDSTPAPTTVTMNGFSAPANLTTSQLASWIVAHPREAIFMFPSGPTSVRQLLEGLPAHLDAYHASYAAAQATAGEPPLNEMVKIGLWIECNVAIGFIVGLGLGSLLGQRTVATILMVALEIIVTPILVAVSIPYFLNGQRLVVGVALDQLRPEWLTATSPTTHGPGHRILVGGHALQIPPMPTWAMVAVIVGWAVVWTVVGAWRMATRDA